MPDDSAEMRRVLAEADCLATAAEVDAALDRMAAAISADLADADPTVYCVMNGGLVVAGRLLARLDFPLRVGYLHATRYGHALQGENRIDWRVAPTEDPLGRTVLVIDDILDEGYTLEAICARLAAAGATRVLSAVLVHKDHPRKARPGMRADYTGLVIADRFLFGSGMDYRSYWRNAPGIFALKGH
ncbi:MAG: hypoxanthine-guanine phosphoribosyltransferase [Betaproteobacteria bacterium]|nr:hypoxanthine-guanine phosphoribosyltransferase [Betaproteobacteria bacterium]